MAINITTTGSRMLTASAVMDKLKVSRAGFGKLTRTDGFPSHQMVAGTGPRWSEKQINDWLLTQPKKASLVRARGAT